MLHAVPSSLLGRLAKDSSGNTIALMAAAIVPILALVGSSVDIGRGYIAQSRLQQACDAGVLAARKRLVATAAMEGIVPDVVAETGQRFFNINFRAGSYGTTDRDFEMTLEPDLAISGEASVIVPSAVMGMFGFEQIPVNVTCEAQLTATNSDIMMVLDTTGSMASTNPGDSDTRMVAMQNTIKSFHAQLSSAVSPNTRLRYGFVPYSTNVNVGHLLQDDWMVDSWDYQSRKRISLGISTGTRTYDRNWASVSGTRASASVESSYPATQRTGADTSVTNDGITTVTPGAAYYTCDTPAPASDYTSNDTVLATNEYPFVGPPTGTQTVRDMRRVENGTRYWLTRSGSTCHVNRQTYSAFTNTFQRVTEPTQQEVFRWSYKPWTYDVANWRTEGNGCIEERDTYPITDFTDVDFTRALDLDIDTVPGSDDATRWRPAYPGVIYARSKRYNGTGSFTTAEVVTNDDYVNPHSIGLASCPAQARQLAEMSASDLDSYLQTLTPTGQTYHDIGMIWGGRLLSPNGLFAADNADVSPSQRTSRHLIFLTDGETAPLDLAYSSYGMEPLDARRWDPSSSITLKDTVEGRFGVACNEVKKRNITVWVVAFGTTLNPVFQQCAGEGHYFEAADNDALEDAFAKIAKSLAELRITK